MDAALAARLREGAEVIADGARRRSAWSTRIPASGRTITAGGTVLIVFGGPRAPHAITFEAPNAANWRHPVYGRGPDRRRWRWVAQIPPRRFLLPAATEDAGNAARVVAKVVDDWGAQLGYK